MKKSRAVISNQSGLHQNLTKIVSRHLKHPFQKPIADHTRQAYESLLPHIGERQLALDSGCGNAKSTQQLARLYPELFIIGIDKSAHRLNKAPATASHSDSPKNIFLLRGDVIDFWRLAVADGLKLARHFLLYPNPWPKSQHLQRRWHGSPAFPELLKLGGELELRSNWHLYVEEFSAALEIAGIESKIEILQPVNGYLTDFEAKYHQSDHTLWKLTANINVDNRQPDSQNPP